MKVKKAVALVRKGLILKRKAWAIVSTARSAFRYVLPGLIFVMACNMNVSIVGYVLMPVIKSWRPFITQETLYNISGSNSQPKDGKSRAKVSYGESWALQMAH